MAEEINTSEQDLGALDVDLTQKSDPVAFADAVIQNLPSSVNLPAKPEAFDIYDKAVGNPLTGPPKLTTNGGLSNAAQVDALMDKAFKQTAIQDNPYSSLRPYTYSGDYDASNFDRYYSTEDVYSKLGFNPYRNNEALYNNKMTFGDQFSRAASQWDNLVATGFMSGVRSWGDMFTDPLAPDIKAARDMERYMAIGSSSTGGIGGFVTNTFLNSGYSIGIGLEFLAEELALMGVTALTGGLTSEITAPLMVNRGASAINKLLRGGKAATKMDGVRAVTNSLDDARSFWNTIGGKVAQGVFDIANPLDNTIKTLKATDYATDFASVSKTFGAFADDMLQIKQSVGEAKIEAGSTKLEVTEQLIQKYRDENGGEDPDEKELAKIDAIASQAAYKTAVWNLPAIMTSNKLMNATILAPLRKVMGNQTTKLVDDYIFSNKTFSKVGDGLLSQTKAAVKSLAKPKFYGQFGMNYLKANIAEGVQENLQEAIAIGAVEHAKALYTDPIRANYEGFMGNFLHGVKDQFSAEGAETFASGLLMGAFSQPVMAAPSVAISKLIKAAQTGDKYKALKALRDEQDKRNVNYLNETYQDALKFFAPDIGNASRTGKLAKDMYTAARMGDKNGTLNNRDAIANHHIITALRTGKFDIMMDRLKEYKKFNDQEIVEAFKKHGVEEQDVKKAAAMIDDVIARAEGIRNNYEQIANKYPNPFNPAKFRDGTPEKKAAQIAKAAWDEATHNVLFAGATFESHSKRIADIAKTFSKVSNTLAGQDAQSLMNLLSSQGTINEINVLRKEIAVLDDTLPDQKTLKVEKQKQLDAISNYYDAIASVKFARTDEERAEAEKKAKEAFGEYVRVLGKKNGKIIFNEALEEAYTLTKDSLLLKNDMDGLAQSLNVLMTPDNFFNLHTALNTSMTEAFDNKVDIISLNQEQFRTYQDINGVVEEITKESGLYLSEELISTLAQLKQKGIVIPEMPAFVDKEGNRVTSGPAYDKAKAIWDAYVKVARTGDIETIKSNYDPKALSTYPQGLVDLLREQYNKLDEDTKSNISFEDWAISDDQEKTRTRYFKYLYKSDFSSIDEKYKSMTLEELNDAITKLNQELEGKEPAAVSEDVEKQKADLRYSIQQLENDLANRIDALVKNGATLEEATKIGTKEFDESEGGKNRVALDKLKADLAALEQPTDIKDKKADIINKLFEKNILTPLNNGNTWMLDGDGRIFVVANINGNKVLFYTSSEGTSGKTEGAWYPVIGISNTGYIIKGTKDSTNSKYNFNEGYGIKEIKDFQDFLNRNITNVKGKDLETLKSIFGDNVETNISYKVNKEFDLAPFINSTYKVQDKKLTFGGYLSREEAIDIWLDRFKAKEVKQNINAELAALEGTTPTEEKAEIIQTNNPTIQTVGNVTFGIANKQGTTEDNEDAVYVDTQNGVFILADGMGGEVSPITTAKDTSKNVINILLGNTTQTIFDQIVGIADKYEIKDVAKFVEDIRKLTGYSFKNTTSINNLFFAIKRKESLNNVKNQRTGATSLKALKKGKNTYIIEKVGDTVFFIVDKNGKVIQSHGLSDVATTQGYMFSIKDGKPFVSSPKTDNFTITLNEGETLVLATDFIETNKAIQDFIDSDFGKNLNFAKFQKNNKQDDSTFIAIKYDAELTALESKPTEVKKADVERKHTFTRDSLKEISDGTGLAKKGTEILNPDKVSSQLNIGDKITFYAERERTGVWDGKVIREDKSNNPFGILGVLSSTDGYIKNQSAIDAELGNLKVEPVTEPVSPRSKEEIESELRMVEDYLAYRLMMNVQMSNSQKEALMRMKAMTDAVENRTKENEKYVINGKKYDLRVTTFVYDLLKKAPYNYESKTFTEEYGKELTDLAKKIFEDNPNKTSTEKINEWIYKAQNNTNLYNLFISRFDEDKINLMKSEMGPKDGFEKFKEIIDKYAYEEAREAGNTIDEVVRLFLSGSPISKPANMSAEAFNSLRNTLRGILSNMHKNGEIILAKNLVVTGELEVDGETKTIAGELDLLVIDKNGNLKIYDIKTGSKSKWDNYGVEGKDKFKYKDAYSLQLSMYKALIEQQTGLNVTTLKVVPLEITKDLKGNVKTLNVDIREKNVNHAFQPIVNKYVKKVSKRGIVPDPFVPVTQRKTGEQVPSLPPTLLTPLSKDEIDSRERNINALNYKIGTLQNKLETLGTDAADIEDTIAYLQNLLDNTVELTHANILYLKDEIKAKIKISKDVVTSSTSAKTKRGQRILNTIDSLKTSYRSDIQLLNDIHNRIADLKSELKTMKAVEKDLNTQIDFYEGLIASSKLRKLDIKELRAKRDALKGKVKTVQRLIDGITNAIRKSINYIKEYVKQVFSAETELKKFTDETKFKPLSTKELRALIDSNLEDDAVFLETYPKLKAEFERLENNVIENLDTVEMLEEVKASEEKRQEELLKSLEKYQNQIRYLDELIEGYKEVDLNKFGVPEDVVSQQPKPTANNQEIKDDTEKTLARQKKEVNESTAKKNEEGIVISVLNFVQNGPQVTQVSIEEMNANLTLDTLKLAKSKNYAILYNGAKYIIGDIGEKSVTLLSPEKPDVTLKEAELAGTVEIVEKESLKATQEEKDLLKSNNELVESTEKELSTTKETLEQLRQNFLNALC